MQYPRSRGRLHIGGELRVYALFCAMGLFCNSYEGRHISLCVSSGGCGVGLMIFFAFDFYFHHVKSFAVYTVDGSLGDESIRIYALDDAEDIY